MSPLPLAIPRRVRGARASLSLVALPLCMLLGMLVGAPAPVHAQVRAGRAEDAHRPRRGATVARRPERSAPAVGDTTYRSACLTAPVMTDRLAACSRAVTEAPADPRLHLYRANVLAALGRDREAAAELEAVTTLVAPTDLATQDLVRGRAVALQARGAVPADTVTRIFRLLAIGLDGVLHADPRNADVLALRCAVAKELRAHREAWLLCDRATKIVPAHTRALAELADLAADSVHAAGTRPVRSERPLSLASSASGFFVDADAHVVTNAHVVRGCKSVRLKPDDGEGIALTVVAVDPLVDLALLRAPGAPPGVAIFRGGRAIRVGDEVVVVGFPLSGLLAEEMNVTSGGVSAQAGIGGNARFLQITAPVQPGNSGGPLLDRSGHVVGIVVAKLDALAVAQVLGDMPQNVNFAIKADVVRTFLREAGIDVRFAPSKAGLSIADVADRARASTVRLQCWR